METDKVNYTQTKDELIPVSSENSEIQKSLVLAELNRFNSVINAEPKADEIKVNKFANNSKYIPIGILENKLDEMFNGLWQTENFKSQVIGNEIVGSIDLLVYHPVLNFWLKRTGTAGVMIRFKKDTDFTDIRNKIINTLVMDYPHLEALCINSAVRKLGKVFGRDLNRDFEDDYKNFVVYLETETVERIKEEIGIIKERFSIKEFPDNCKELLRRYQKLLQPLELKELQNYINKTYLEMKKNKETKK